MGKIRNPQITLIAYMNPSLSPPPIILSLSHSHTNPLPFLKRRKFPIIFKSPIVNHQPPPRSRINSKHPFHPIHPFKSPPTTHITSSSSLPSSSLASRFARRAFACCFFIFCSSSCERESTISPRARFASSDDDDKGDVVRS